MSEGDLPDMLEVCNFFWYPTWPIVMGKSNELIEFSTFGFFEHPCTYWDMMIWYKWKHKTQKLQLISVHPKIEKNCILKESQKTFISKKTARFLWYDTKNGTNLCWCNSANLYVNNIFLAQKKHYKKNPSKNHYKIFH